MKIRINTTITPYTRSVIVKPKHPLWKLRNVGTAAVIINDIFTISGNNEFGVDASDMILPIIEHVLDKNPNEPIEIVNDTQFSIEFPTSGPIGKKVLLFETSFTIER